MPDESYGKKDEDKNEIRNERLPEDLLGNDRSGRMNKADLSLIAGVITASS